jgi:hypothetical protein
MGRSNAVDTFLDVVEMFYNIISIVFLILFVIGFIYLFSRVSTGGVVYGGGPSVVYGGGPPVVYGGGPSVVVNRTTVSEPSRAPRFRFRSRR